MKVRMLRFFILQPSSFILFFSGRRDLNPRPLEPHSSALPSCATARSNANYSPSGQNRQVKLINELDGFKPSSLQRRSIKSFTNLFLKAPQQQFAAVTDRRYRENHAQRRNCRIAKRREVDAF